MRRLLIVLLVIGAAIFAVAVTEWMLQEPPSSTAPVPHNRTVPTVSSTPNEGIVRPSSSGTTVRPRQPSHLRIWHYDAPVVALLLTDSELVPPSDPTVLGWWGRPACAKQGTTLLAGHTVHTGGGTFDDLEDIPVGVKGSLSGCAYEVASVEVISKTELASRAHSLFRQTGKPRLVLVTCEDYDPATGHYASNVVVTLTPA